MEQAAAPLRFISMSWMSGQGNYGGGSSAANAPNAMALNQILQMLGLPGFGSNISPGAMPTGGVGGGSAIPGNNLALLLAILSGGMAPSLPTSATGSGAALGTAAGAPGTVQPPSPSSPQPVGTALAQASVPSPTPPPASAALPPGVDRVEGGNS